jgi:1-acyl-sn-glycerol-3-phosphate acyltransferase
MIRWLFERYVRWKIGTGLDGMWVRGLAEARALHAAGPVVFAATHSAWWDGLLLFPLDTALGGGSRVWMNATNLARLSFFGAMGALPLHVGEPSKLREDLRIAVRYLSGPKHCLWVFPQGTQRPTWLRPLGLQRGATLVASISGATLVPVAVGYAYREAPMPAVYVDFGEPVPHDSLEEGLLAGLARIDAHLAGADPDAYAALIPSRVRRTDDGFWARMLARLVRRG